MTDGCEKQDTGEHSGSSQFRARLRCQLGRGSKRSEGYLSCLRSCVIFVILPLLAAATAKADLLFSNDVTITNSVFGDCSGLTGGSLDLTATGGFLDFGNRADFGSTESCGEQFSGGSQAYTGSTVTTGTPFYYTGAFCDLSSCNPNPYTLFTDPIELEFTSQTGGIITDDFSGGPDGLSGGGSFDLTFDITGGGGGGGAPEPSSFLLLGSGLFLGGLRFVRSRKRAAPTADRS